MRYCIVSRDDSHSKEMEGLLLKTLEKDAFFEFDEKSPETIIVIGGDGTFLAALHRYISIIDNIKFLCFNTGTIGYYNEFVIDDYKEILESLKNSTINTKKFALLEYVSASRKEYAINEFILSGLCKNVEYDVYLDNVHLEEYFGVGLVVSSSTGSMGYNRSLNGAIVDIDTNAMELTEVAAIRSKAYSSIGSPIVLSGNRTLKFVEKNERPGHLLADNIEVAPQADLEFEIRISKHKVTCYSVEKDSFLIRLKKTLGF